MLRAVTNIDMTVTVEVLVILFLDLGVYKNVSSCIFIIFFTFLFAYYTSIKTLKTISQGVRLCSDTNSRKTWHRLHFRK